MSCSSFCLSITFTELCSITSAMRSGWLRHEHSRVGFTSGQIGQCANMILMGMGDNNMVDLMSGIS